MNPCPSSPTRFSAGDLAPVEQQLAHRRGAPAHLLLELAELEPRPSPSRRRTPRCPFGPSSPVRAITRYISASPAVGDEPLRPGQAPAAVVRPLGPRPQRRRVRPAGGLRQRVGARATRRESSRGRYRAFRSSEPNSWIPNARQVVHRQRHRQRQGARSRSPPAPPGTSGRTARRPRALVVRDAGQAHLAQLAEQLAGELAALLVPAAAGRDPLVGERRARRRPRSRWSSERPKSRSTAPERSTSRSGRFAAAREGRPPRPGILSDHAPVQLAHAAGRGGRARPTAGP